MRQANRLVGWLVVAVLLGAACAARAAAPVAPSAPQAVEHAEHVLLQRVGLVDVVDELRLELVCHCSPPHREVAEGRATKRGVPPVAVGAVGLDVEVMYVASGTSTMQSLVSGDMQFVQTGGTEVPSAALGGAPVKMLVGWINVVPSLFMVDPAITTLEQLRGKAVGITKFGAQSHSGARLALRKWGLNPDTDVQYLQLGGVPEILGGMQAGVVVGGAFSPPTNALARRLGYRVLGDLSQMPRLQVGGKALPDGLAIGHRARDGVDAQEVDAAQKKRDDRASKIVSTHQTAQGDIATEVHGAEEIAGRVAGAPRHLGCPGVGRPEPEPLCTSLRQRVRQL